MADNLDLVGVFAEGRIVEHEVRASLFDGAEIAISFVNWEDPDGHGEIRLRRGHAGRDAPHAPGLLPRRAAGPVTAACPEHARGVQPQLSADLGDQRCKFPIQPPVLARDQAVSAGDFYRVATAAGTGSAQYEDRIYEVTGAGTTASVQPPCNAAIGASTADSTAILKAYDSFTRMATIESITDQRVFGMGAELAGFADGWFEEAAVTFDTGANAGRTIEVKRWTQATGTLELWAPVGLPAAVRDQLLSTPAATSASSA